MPRYWITETAHYPDGRTGESEPKWLDAPAAENVLALYRQRHPEQVASEVLDGEARESLRGAFRVENGNNPHVLDVLVEPDRTGNPNADPAMHANREYIELRGLHLVEPTAAGVAGRLREIEAASSARQGEADATVDPIAAMRRSIDLHATDGAGRAYLHSMLGDVLDHIRAREEAELDEQQIRDRLATDERSPYRLDARLVPVAHEPDPYRVEIKEATKDERGNAIHPQVSVRATGPTREDATHEAGEMYRQALAEVGRVAPSRVGRNEKGPGA